MSTLRELEGWLFEVYASQAGAELWVIGEDGVRHHFTQPFPTSFIIYSTSEHLAAIEQYVWDKYPNAFVETLIQRDLYEGELITLSVTAPDPVTCRKIAERLKRWFSKARFYNLRPPFPLLYFTQTGIFPLAKCRLTVQGDQVQAISTDEDRWAIQKILPPLRQMVIVPNCDPALAEPQILTITFEQQAIELDLTKSANSIQAFQEILNSYDPDIIFAEWGDGWLFPTLQQKAKQLGIAFNPNRDHNRQPRYMDALTFESYGSVYHRTNQTRLFGRWQIDPHNSTMDMGFNFSIMSAVELARVTGLDVQTAARNSPGSGFTMMQIRTALESDILIPEQKHQVESLKSLFELNTNDRGGLNYRPVVGVHAHAAELDFFSMYPSIMHSWNISGEKVGHEGEKTRQIPGTDIIIDQDAQGLVPGVLEPLLIKRKRLKALIRQLPKDDPKIAEYQSMADALKWLGYVSFGYQGFKNNLFGSIHAHEAICAGGRESLVTAIETAHEFGFEVLAANVDSLFVQKEGCTQEYHFQQLIDVISKRTRLTLEMEGIFDWIAFLAAKSNPHVGAANRYFGKFQGDNKLKVRGLAQRRSDTPKWIKDVEIQVLNILAEESEADQLDIKIYEVEEYLKKEIQRLRAEEIPLKDLVAKVKLGRELDAYKGNSLAASAARQLQRGNLQIGQRVQFIYTHGAKSHVIPWEVAQGQGYSVVNKQRYIELVQMSVGSITKAIVNQDELFSLFEYK